MFLNSEYAPHMEFEVSFTYCHDRFVRSIFTFEKRKHKRQATGSFPQNTPRENRATAEIKNETHRQKFLRNQFFPAR